MSTKPGANDAAVIFFPDAAAFDAWLHEHFDLHDGVWLKIAKKNSGVPSLTDDEAVDLGLRYGWISGQRKSLDARYYLLCSPRSHSLHVRKRRRSKEYQEGSSRCLPRDPTLG